VSSSLRVQYFTRYSNGLAEKPQWMLITSNLGLLIWGFGWCCMYAYWDSTWSWLMASKTSNTSSAGSCYPATARYRSRMSYGQVISSASIFPSHFGLLVRHFLPSFPRADQAVGYGIQTSMNAEEGLYW